MMNDYQSLERFVPRYLRISTIYSVIVTDFEGKYLYTNDVFRNKFSLVTDDFIGKSANIALHPEDAAKCATAAAFCMQNQDKSAKVMVRKPHQTINNYRYSSWEFACLQDDNLNPIGIICVGHDVTDETQNAAILQDTNNKFEAILNSSNETNILIGKDYSILSFNNLANKVATMQINRRLEIGASILGYILPGDEESFIKNVNRSLNGEVIKFDKELKFPNSSVWVRVIYYPAYDVEKNIIGVAFTTSDISEKKLAEESLKESQAILKSLYDSSAETYLFLSVDLTILFANKVYKELRKNTFGKEPRVGCNVLEFKRPEFKEEFNNYYNQVLLGNTVNIEKEYNDNWWAFSIFPVYNEENKITGIAENAKNITQDKTYLNKIISQNEVLNQIAWEHSHSVRKPLANIMAIVELLQDESDPSELDKLTSLIATSAEELDSIIHTINDISQNIE